MKTRTIEDVIADKRKALMLAREKADRMDGEIDTLEAIAGDPMRRLEWQVQQLTEQVESLQGRPHQTINVEIIERLRPYIIPAPILPRPWEREPWKRSPAWMGKAEKMHYVHQDMAHKMLTGPIG